MYTFLETEVFYFQVLFFKVLMNLSAKTDFHSLCVEDISVSLFWKNDFIVKFTAFFFPHFVCFTIQ